MMSSAGQIRKRIVITTAILIGVLAVILFGVETYFSQSYRMLSRTIEARQFKRDGPSYDLSLQAVQGFEARHALDPEMSGGLRVYIEEWPTWKYLLSFQNLKDGSLRGAILAVPYSGNGRPYERDFKVEEWQARIFLPSFDRQIDGFWGSYASCTDGTSFQFERWRDHKVWSGSGNAACQLHYAELRALVAETLVPQLHDIPFDWLSWFDEKRILFLAGRGK